MGNLNAIEAKTLLSQMGRHLGDDGRAIIGVDLQKNVDTLLRERGCDGCVYGTDPSDYRAEAKRVVVAYKVEEDGALSH
jgi:hypothetical protein